jgi:hypothetical protein
MQLGGSTIPATPNRIIAGSQNREMLSISNIQQEKSASNSRERKETNVNPFSSTSISLSLTFDTTPIHPKTAANPQRVSDRTQMCESGGWVRGGFQGDGDLLLLRP